MVLEVVAVVVYRNSADGQASALSVFIVTYAILAFVSVAIIDRTVGWFRRRHFANRSVKPS